jgi:hypothetical protein
MKETIRICFCDFWPEIKQEDIFTPILSKYFNVIVDNNKPDVVFHSIFNGMKDISKYPKAKKILFIGENRRPDFTKTNFAISFDKGSDINYRLPLWQYFILLRPEYKEVLFKEKTEVPEYDRFCSFTVSNPGNFMRNGLYTTLNQYKRVHSYGRYLNNCMDLIKISDKQYWRDAKDIFFSNVLHKFCIAYENNSYPYYCTEKIMDAFLGSSIPIYWGDPKIMEDFNEKAFINANKTSTQEIINQIKLLDQKPDLFEHVYKQPIFTEEQQLKLLDNLDEFEHWLVGKINS